MKIANIGGSSRRDIVLAPAEYAGSSYRISWFEAPADARAAWPERVVTSSEAVVHGLALADFDRNGRTDIASAEMHQGSDPDAVRVWLQGSAGTFAAQSLSGQGSHNIAAADLDGDGRVDLFGANHSSAQAADGARAKIWRNRLP